MMAAGAGVSVAWSGSEAKRGADPGRTIGRRLNRGGRQGRAVQPMEGSALGSTLGTKGRAKGLDWNGGRGLAPASGGPALNAVSPLSVSLYWRGELVWPRRAGL
jgi:hypothetical protein